MPKRKPEPDDIEADFDLAGDSLTEDETPVHTPPPNDNRFDVSILMPAYNATKTIVKAMRSVTSKRVRLGNGVFMSSTMEFPSIETEFK